MHTFVCDFNPPVSIFSAYQTGQQISCRQTSGWFLCMPTVDLYHTASFSNSHKMIKVLKMEILFMIMMNWVKFLERAAARHDKFMCWAIPCFLLCKFIQIALIIQETANNRQEIWNYKLIFTHLCVKRVNHCRTVCQTRAFTCFKKLIKHWHELHFLIKRNNSVFVRNAKSACVNQTKKNQKLVLTGFHCKCILIKIVWENLSNEWWINENTSPWDK